MSTSLKAEFRPVKFGLGYFDPDAFIRSQWNLPRWVYLVWKCFWFVWHLAWIIGSGVNTRLNKARYPEEGVKWFIYLTNTTLLLTTLTCTVDLMAVVFVTCFRKGSVIVPVTKDQEARGLPLKEEIIFKGEFTVEKGLEGYTTTWYLKLVWLLYNMIGSINILVTIMYWAVEYNGSTDVVGVEVHSINTVFILTNHMMTAMPCQILHFIYPILYLALYALFTYIYYACDGTDIKGRPVIYSVVDWGKAYPTAITVVVGILVCVPLVHLVLFAIYTFRIFLHSKINSETYSTGTHNQENSRNDETRREMHEVPSGVEMRPIAVS